jgi:hypothetical protein
MMLKRKRRIDIPQSLVPKDYIGEKFGVLLVFLKGDTDTEIENKAERIKEFCAEMRKEGNA